MPGFDIPSNAASNLYQPNDSDLTAIAALNTTSYGRSLLTPPDPLTADTMLGLGSLPPTFMGLGDSITANGGNLWTTSSSGGSGAIDGRSWHLWGQLAANSAVQWIGSSATGGHTINQVLTVDLPIILGMSRLPKYVVVMAGQNDMASPTTAFADYTSIVTKLMSVGVKPILSTLTPSAVNTAILQLNAFIRRIATYYHLPLVDMYPSVMDHTTGLWKAAYSPDSVHPNSTGANIMGLTLGAVLTALEPINLAATWLPQHNVGWSGYGLKTNTSPLMLTDDAGTPPKATDWNYLQGSWASAAAFSTPGGPVQGRRLTLTGNGTGAGSLIARVTAPAPTIGHNYAVICRLGATVVSAGATWQFGIINAGGPIFDLGRFTGASSPSDLVPSILFTTFTATAATLLWDFVIQGAGGVMTVSEILVFDLTAAGVTI